ncbi:MAG: ComF family protein [Nitrospira sp.]|nr:ComF family protein [Nitrospira sp.]MDH4303973.1 ComF family protein [Nitrospira sp.]MDH5194949.1 ComF family protein [Nitrospira sp.]
MAAFPPVPALLRRATRFFFPIQCVVCGSPLTDDLVPHFCTSCWSTLQPMPTARCARCDRPFVSPAATAYSPQHRCYACVEHPPSYTRAWTLYPYTPPLQDAIRLLKYQGKVSLVTPLANLMLTTLPQVDAIDLVIPVPLHHERLCQREFNQALLLADQIGRHLSISVSYTNLVRTTPTPPQTTLSRRNRLKNLRHTFAVQHPAELMNKRILLIDDVFTTGTTVNECAKTLRRSGSADVFVLTLARTIDQNLIPDHTQPAAPYPFSNP